MNQKKLLPSLLNSIIKLVISFAVLALLLSSSAVRINDPMEAMRRFSRDVEFDFTEWTVEALFQKAVSASLKTERFFSESQQAEIVGTYLEQVSLVSAISDDLDLAVAAPELEDRERQIESIRQRLEMEQAYLDQLSSLAEAVLQNQTENTLVDLGFGFGGQVFPPVLYRVSELPLNLIISPREEIKTVLDVSLEAGLDSLEKDAIEEGIYQEFDYSALVEPIGGMSAYPTMVMQTTDLNWLTEVIAHEWIHNWLIFRPLGVHYYDNGDMRTINETVASLSGTEIGSELIQTYFPERVLSPPAPKMHSRLPGEKLPEEAIFNYRAEMRATRIKVDELLAAGQVDQAEAYMEQRRQYFWENGYHIRKLNQAYFAFYGSYNDTPGGGASGIDPVGPAVTKLRAQCPTLKSFLDAISKVSSYEELEQILAERK